MARVQISLNVQSSLAPVVFHALCFKVLSRINIIRQARTLGNRRDTKFQFRMPHDRTEQRRDKKGEEHVLSDGNHADFQQA
mmetsp:Transcript_33450/g.81181  ORF Transcript_33450/g.81181 Transcript_33450/m.81181 type:complete len:81 (-) Transcript_33450:382-624(-)